MRLDGPGTSLILWFVHHPVGGLFARTPTANAEIQDLLTRALSPLGSGGEGGSTIATRPSGPGHWCCM